MGAENAMNKSTMIKLFLNVLIPVIIALIPANEIFTPQLKVYFVITMLAILAFAFEVINTTVVSLLLPILYTLFNLAPAEVVYSSFANNMLWMVLGGLMLADMANKTGLLRRIAFKCIIWAGGTYRGIIYGLAVAGVISTVLLGGNGVIPMAALGFGICVAMNQDKNMAAAGIMLTAGFGCMLSGSFLFNPAPLMYAGFAGMPEVLNDFGWLDYFTKQAVGVIYFVVTIVIVERMCRPKESMNGKAYFISEYQKLGKVSSSEWKSAFICILLLISVLTVDYHKISLMWCFAIVPLLAYMPGIAICDDKDIMKTNFGMVFFIAACLSIGTVGTALGIGQIVSNLAMPILEGKSASFVFFIIYIIFILLNFVMAPAAIGAAFSLPFATICINLGINPQTFFLFETIALDQIFLPYEYVMYLAIFSFGVMTTKDFFKILTVKFIFATIYIFLLLIPFWKAIGFLMM